LPLLFGAMLGYFLLPLLAIVLISFADSAIGPRNSLAAVEAYALLVKSSLLNYQYIASSGRYFGARCTP
jgi:hypothetical protein